MPFTIACLTQAWLYDAQSATQKALGDMPPVTESESGPKTSGNLLTFLSPQKAAVKVNQEVGICLFGILVSFFMLVTLLLNFGILHRPAGKVLQAVS